MRREILIFVTLLVSAHAWDDDDLEVFDVVEEVNQNFYELMGVSQDATRREIKTAFNSLTLRLHPDKNPSPDADEQFRNLVSVHNILKDPGKRQKYDDVLKNGLPNWRSAVYYYRHVRRMGLAEGALILFLIVSVSQYAVSWAAYIEKRYTAEQILSSRSGGKKNKRSGFESDLAEVMASVPRPSVRDTLPLQLPRAVWAAITALPGLGRELLRRRRQAREDEIRRRHWEEQERLRLEQQQAELEEAKSKRREARRRRHVLPERDGNSDTDAVGSGAPDTSATATKSCAGAVVSGGLWTDDDLAELVRLVKKYPGGSEDRWERIAQGLNRPVAEVTVMAQRLRDRPLRTPQSDPDPPPEPIKKVKTRKPVDVVGSAAGWSQAQQAALEAALARHSKRTPERWLRIAACVPGKTQEECMQRCRYLSEMLRKSREQKEEDQSQPNGETEVNEPVTVSNGTVREEC